MSAFANRGVPERMKALQIKSFGGPEVLETVEVDVPEISSQDLLIEVAFCGICRHDLLTRDGAFPDITLPVIPGHQVSGYVAVVGDEVDDFSVGQRVMTTIYTGCGRCDSCAAGNQALCQNERPAFLGEDTDGGYAEYVKVRHDIALPVPEGMSLRKAAVLTCTLGTAYHAVATQATTVAGETVLITGASGGVGVHAIKVAKHLGARVIAISSSPAKQPLLKAAGADEILVSPDLDFRRDVKSLTDGKGAHVAIEIVGAATLNESIRSIRNGGRIVVVGNVEGKPVEIRPAHFILKEIGLTGTKSCTLPELETALSLVASGKIHLELGESLSLEKGAEAHRTMEEENPQGRMTLEIQGEGQCAG